MSKYNFRFDDEPIEPPKPLAPKPVVTVTEYPQLAPPTLPEIPVSKAKPQLSFWTSGFACLAILFFCLWVSTFESCQRVVPPKPDDGTVVIPEGDVFVGIFYEDTDMGSLTDTQRRFLQSADVTAYLQEKAKDWKKLDAQDDVSAIHPVYKEMKDQHMSRLPWIIIKSGSKMASEPILNYDDSMALLKKWLK